MHIVTRFVVFSVFIAVLWLLGTVSNDQPIGPFALSGILTALCVWITPAYLSAQRRANATQMLSRPVWWSMFMDGHVLRLVVAAIIALVLGLGLVVGLSGQGAAGLGWLAATGTVAIGAESVLRRRFATSLLPYAARGPGFRIAPWVAAAIASAIWALIAPHGPAPAAYVGTSHLVEALRQSVEWTDKVRLFALDQSVESGLPRWMADLFLLTAHFTWFFSAALVAQAFVLPLAEWGRILMPSAADTPPRIGTFTVAVSSALVTVLLLAIPSTLARLDPLVPRPDARNYVDQPVTWNDPVTQAAVLAQQMPYFDKMGALFCPPGTVEDWMQIEAHFGTQIDGYNDEMRDQIALGFAEVRARVPAFLDWYYSLSAEYLRTANLLVGNGEEYLNDQLKTILGAESQFDGLYALAGDDRLSSLMDSYGAKRRSLLDPCKDSVRKPYIIAQTLQQAEIVSASLLSALTFQSRIESSVLAGAAGGVTAAVIAKVGAKLVVASTFKAAAGAIAKIAASKAIGLGGGVAVGAFSGGVAGSVLPGAGTFIGAIAGGVIGGSLIMLGVDYSLLKLDEAISRKAFEAEIIAAIGITQAELLRELNL